MGSVIITCNHEDSLASSLLWPQPQPMPSVARRDPVAVSSTVSMLVTVNSHGKFPSVSAVTDTSAVAPSLETNGSFALLTALDKLKILLPTRSASANGT